MLKDVNYLKAHRISRGRISDFGAKRNEIFQIIKKDVEFLKSCGLMDYSCLLAVEVGCTQKDAEH